MKRRGVKSTLLWLLMAVLVLTACSFAYAGEMNEEKKCVADEVLVRFVSGTDEADKESMRENLGAEIIEVITSIRVEHWKLPEDVTVDQALEILMNEPCIESAEPNCLCEIQAIPNDTYFNNLWFLRNWGQEVNGLPSKAGADISAPQAWDIEEGSRDVVIAVVDWGVDYEHHDWADNIWTNAGEIPHNGADDDNNGYNDDVHGWDFYGRDNDPSDTLGHGTHVAGIIAAQGGNATGVAGVMWHAQIMQLRIKTRAHVLLAIQYAVDNGARIINCSFVLNKYYQDLYDVISYANVKGVLVVAAAGNGGRDQRGDNSDERPCYPSSYDLPNIISVAATNQLDKLASYSNYGPETVDVAAPGGSLTRPNILSTVPGHEYDYKSGTSMAAPVVSGVAGLIWSNNPDLTHIEVKDAILNSVDTLDLLKGKILTGGRVNACNALPPPAPTDLSAIAASRSQINLTRTDNAPNETGFAIERKTGSGGEFAEIDTVDANTASYSDKDVTEGAT